MIFFEHRFNSVVMCDLNFALSYAHTLDPQIEIMPSDNISILEHVSINFVTFE